ncbi:MAG: hypothetical protein DRP02_01025 [Candidatus Gerdarchaeota archaeon]|nr:MAG: hypothetical protein DRP02_01025 [Candidatus Gerdarchaeota archaeon]
MILPKYVAVQAYLEATGTAFADLKYLEPLITAMLERKNMTIEDGREILGFKSDIAKTIFNLLQHIGVLAIEKKPEGELDTFILTNFTKFVLDKKKPGQSIVQPLTPFFLSWLPFKIFLKYLQNNPGANLNEIRTKLGAQILRHTSDIKALRISDIIRRGAYIPFNEMVIAKVLANIGEYLGLVTYEKNTGPYYLSPLGKYVTNSIDLLNFQFKNLDPKISPMNLAFLDFVERGGTNLIAFSNTEGLDALREFYRMVEDKIALRTLVRILYTKSNFNALISTDSAFWNFTYRFSNITYDPIKVLEFNSKIMDFIEV